MKYVLLWIAVLGAGIGVAVCAEARPSESMHGAGAMMGQGMMGAKMYAVRFPSCAI